MCDCNGGSRRGCCGGGAAASGCCGGAAGAPKRAGGAACCGGGAPAAGAEKKQCTEAEKKQLKDAVREGYGAVAASAPEAKTDATAHIAKEMGYTDEQLASLPDGANMGLQCGNPTAIANLKEGERVVDLGSGGGLDVFLAAKKVGPAGRAVGLDMTMGMIRRARAAALRANITNVEFVYGEMENMPFANGEFDCIISNCVINLSPDKDAVFRECMRVLKPGGRLCVSDMVRKGPLPDEVKESVQAVIGCVGNAILVSDYEAGLKRAGFDRVEIVDEGRNLNSYFDSADSPGCCGSSCCGPSAQGDAAPLAGHIDILRKYDLNKLAASVRVTAWKKA